VLASAAAGLGVRLADVTREEHIDPAGLGALPLERAAAVSGDQSFRHPEPVTSVFAPLRTDPSSRPIRGAWRARLLDTLGKPS